MPERTKLLKPELREQIQAAIRRAAAASHRALLDLLFPPECLICTAGLENCQTASLLCDSCFEEMTGPAQPRCEKCGVQFIAAHAATPGCDCRKRKFAFDRVATIGGYQNPLRGVVLRMKHRSEVPLCGAIAERMAVSLREPIMNWKPQAIVPVPMHWRRWLVRRHNSPAVIAEILSAKLGVPIKNGLLKRIKPTRPQAGLQPQGRAENMRGAFSVKSGVKLTKTRILLIDDVMTTGATCHEAARTLRKAGAEAVMVAVAARAQD